MKKLFQNPFLKLLILWLGGMMCVSAQENILTNGDFENDSADWAFFINETEVGTKFSIDETNPLAGSKSLLLDHPAAGNKGMFRVAARAGMALDSSMTYDVHATVKVESDYPDGKRLGLVAKENQGAFAHYWTQQDGTIEINETFYWGDASSDSTTLQFMLGYAGEDHDQTGNPEAYKVYIDEVKVFERPTVAPTGISINEEDQVIKQGETTNLTATMAPEEADLLVKWFSRDNDIAAVDEGVVTGKAGGEVYIIAQSIVDKEIEDSVKITVYPDIITNGDFENDSADWAFFINE
ncbi:MAG: Ig domain-containing protein, partial [Bacteroidales bacterium]